jgi:anti-anti-sigma factor
MDNELGGLLVYDVGPSTLIGFKAVEVVDDHRMEQFRAGLEQLLQEHKVKTLVVDLTGVKTLSSGVLGFFFHLHRQGVQVRIYNPSDHIREVLAITQLNSLLQEVDTPQ